MQSGFDLLPELDLSHLSPEERMAILEVAARAQQVAMQDNESYR